MSALEKYLYSVYEVKRESIKEARGGNHELSGVYSALNEILGTKDYISVMEVLSADDDDYAFSGYRQGFKDGMKFLLHMVTV